MFGLEHVCVCLGLAACAAGALQLCVFRDLLWYSMASESWPWTVTVWCVCVLTQGHCVCPSECEWCIKCVAAHGAWSLLISLPRVATPSTPPRPSPISDPPKVRSAWATSTSRRRPRWASSALHAWPKWSWGWPAGESPTGTPSPSPTHAWCWRCSLTGSGSRYGTASICSAFSQFTSQHMLYSQSICDNQVRSGEAMEAVYLLHVLTKLSNISQSNLSWVNN